MCYRNLVVAVCAPQIEASSHAGFCGKLHIVAGTYSRCPLPLGRCDCFVGSCGKLVHMPSPSPVGFGSAIRVRCLLCTDRLVKSGLAPRTPRETLESKLLDRLPVHANNRVDFLLELRAAWGGRDTCPFHPNPSPPLWRTLAQLEALKNPGQPPSHPEQPPFDAQGEAAIDAALPRSASPALSELSNEPLPPEAVAAYRAWEGKWPTLRFGVFPTPPVAESSGSPPPGGILDAEPLSTKAAGKRPVRAVDLSSLGPLADSSPEPAAASSTVESVDPSSADPSTAQSVSSEGVDGEGREGDGAFTPSDEANERPPGEAYAEKGKDDHRIPASDSPGGAANVVSLTDVERFLLYQRVFESFLSRDEQGRGEFWGVNSHSSSTEPSFSSSSDSFRTRYVAGRRGIIGRGIRGFKKRLFGWRRR